jgi:hypothetical protein
VGGVPPAHGRGKFFKILLYNVFYFLF